MRQFCTACLKDKDVTMFTRKNRVYKICNPCAQAAAARMIHWRGKKKREWEETLKARAKLEAMKNNNLTRNADVKVPIAAEFH